jgi:hypothetical protein
MDDAMKIRDLNFKVTCLQNGLRIEKGQALVAYKENQDLKREVDRLETGYEQLRIAALNAVCKIGGGKAKADLRDAYDKATEQLEALKDQG